MIKNTNKKKKFSDVMPDWAKNIDARKFIIPEVIAMVVNLSQSVKPKADEETAYTDLTEYAGIGLVDPVVVRLAANVGLLCRTLADGKNKKTIHDYLNYLIFAAFFQTNCVGCGLLAVVADTVGKDLLGDPNCKFHHHLIGQRRSENPA